MLNLYLFFFLQLFSSNSGTHKNNAQSSSPRVHYKALYPWASDELLDECTTLTSVEDVENHLGDLWLYNFNAFCKTHDSHISIRHGTPVEPVCVDDKSNGGKPFFFLYQAVFKRIGLREGAAHGGQRSPCPTTSQWLGLRPGFPDLVWVPGPPTISGRFPSLL